MICVVRLFLSFFVQKILGAEAERNYYESQLIILDTLHQCLNGVGLFLPVIMFLIV